MKVTAPTDAANAAWGLNGQTITVSIQVSSTIKDLKEMLSGMFGAMPANKQQLKGKLGYLKDVQTLAGTSISCHFALNYNTVYARISAYVCYIIFFNELFRH